MFSSRQQAGEQLAEKLTQYSSPHTIVLGIPRGGVVIAKSIAEKLKVPFDVVVVRKLSAPHNPEFAIGALAPDDVSHVEWRHAQQAGADEAYMKDEIEKKSEELTRREQVYRKGKKYLKIAHKTVIIVDDGVATGSTMEAAIKWARKKKAHRVIVATPVAPEDTARRIRPEVEELIVLEQPKEFEAVSQFYESFPQVEDEEVVGLVTSS